MEHSEPSMNRHLKVLSVQYDQLRQTQKIYYADTLLCHLPAEHYISFASLCRRVEKQNPTTLRLVTWLLNRPGNKVPYTFKPGDARAIIARLCV